MGGIMTKTKTIIAALAMCVFATAASAKDWDLAAAYSDAIFHTQNLKLFAKDVAAETGGKLNVKVHSGGSLIKKNKDNRNAVRSKQIPLGEFLGAWFSNENSLFAIDTLPFLASSYDAAQKLWSVSKAPIEAALDKQGLKLLFAVPWPPQALYSVKPLNSMDDLKGLKFRTYSPFTSRVAQLAGAAGTEIQPPLATAFQTGRVEAMITSSSFGVSNKAWDYLGYFYDTQAWLPKNFIVVNKRMFGALDKDLQKGLLAAARKAEKRGWEMSAASNDDAKKTLAKNGMKVSAPGSKLKAGFENIGQTMSGEWAKGAGSEGVSIIKAFRK
jgi:TRAP-type C4-dicarboxylate transport system substrate-binding protein